MGKMDNYLRLVVLFYFINILRGELSLEIIKTVNETEEPVTDAVQALVGTNLTLTCKLIGDNNETNQNLYNEVYWSRKIRNIGISDLDNLKKLAINALERRMHSTEKSNGISTITKFQPLTMKDKGTYFCINMKNQLFRMINLEVKVGQTHTDLDSEFTGVLSQLRSYLKPKGDEFTYPAHLCNENMFNCTSHTSCVDKKHVCDGVRDCEDDSDESYHLCGLDACAGKKQCSNGRCMSLSLCCDKYYDIDCEVDLQPGCCFEEANNYFDSNKNLKKYYPDFAFEDDNVFDFSNNNFNYELHSPEIETNNTWMPMKSRILWIIMPCIVILVVVILCIILRQYLAKSPRRLRTTQSSHCPVPIARRGVNPNSVSTTSGRVSPAAVRLTPDSNVLPRLPAARVSPAAVRLTPDSSVLPGPDVVRVSPIPRKNLDLPPSYDEAVALSVPTAPPLD